MHGDYDTAILWQWLAICHVIHQCPSVGLPALDYRLFSIIAHNKIRRNVQDQKAGQSLFGCMTSWPVGITPDHAARLALITSLIAWLLDRWFVWYSRGDISMMYDIMWSQCLYLLWNNFSISILRCTFVDTWHSRCSKLKHYSTLHNPWHLQKVQIHIYVLKNIDMNLNFQLIARPHGQATGCHLRVFPRNLLLHQETTLHMPCFGSMELWRNTVPMTKTCPLPWWLWSVL